MIGDVAIGDFEPDPVELSDGSMISEGRPNNDGDAGLELSMSTSSISSTVITDSFKGPVFCFFVLWSPSSSSRTSSTTTWVDFDTWEISEPFIVGISDIWARGLRRGGNGAGKDKKEGGVEPVASPWCLNSSGGGLERLLP